MLQTMQLTPCAEGMLAALKPFSCNMGGCACNAGCAWCVDSRTGDTHMACYYFVTHHYNGCKYMQHHVGGRCHNRKGGSLTCLES